MSDLVKRLRKEVVQDNFVGLLDEAAARIEVLEAALRPFAEFGDPRNLNHELTMADCYAAYIALAPEQDK